MFKEDLIVKTVNYLLRESKKAEDRVKGVLLGYLSKIGASYEIRDISHAIEVFEEMCRDKEVLNSMKSAAKKEYNEIAEKLFELSLKNTRIMLELRRIAEEEKIEWVESREEAISLIERVFGSTQAYIQSLKEIGDMEKMLSKRKSFILRICSWVAIKRFQGKLERLERELLKD
jgi:hypothetical protein